MQVSNLDSGNPVRVIGFLRGGGDSPLMFPKVPQSSLGILYQDVAATVVVKKSTVYQVFHAKVQFKEISARVFGQDVLNKMRAFLCQI